MADYTHADLERDFAPLGEWNDADTRARIATIVQEGTQATPQEVSVYNVENSRQRPLCPHIRKTLSNLTLSSRIPTRCAPPKAGAHSLVNPCLISPNNCDTTAPHLPDLGVVAANGRFDRSRKSGPGWLSERDTVDQHRLVNHLPVDIRRGCGARKEHPAEFRQLLVTAVPASHCDHRGACCQILGEGAAASRLHPGSTSGGRVG